MHILRLPLLCLLLCVPLLASCGKSHPTSFYLLDSQAPPLNTNNMPRTTLAMEMPVIPAYLERPGIVVRDAKGAGLTVPQFNVWAEPLQQSVRRILSVSMTEPLLRQGITLLPSHINRRNARYGLFVEILRFDADSEGHVRLESRWTLEDKGSDRVIERGNFAAAEDIAIPAFGSRQMFDDIVAAESRLMQRFGNDLATRLALCLPKYEASAPQAADRTRRYRDLDRERDLRDRDDRDRLPRTDDQSR